MERLKAKCKYCGKEFYSLYPSQLKYNVDAHELSCKTKTDPQPERRARADNRKRPVTGSGSGI